MRFPGLAKDWQLLPKIEAIEDSFQGKNDIVISDMWMLIFKTEKRSKGRVQAPSQTRQQKPDRAVEDRGCTSPVWNCRKNGNIGSKNSLGVYWRKMPLSNLGLGEIIQLDLQKPVVFWKSPTRPGNKQQRTRGFPAKKHQWGDLNPTFTLKPRQECQPPGKTKPGKLFKNVYS